MGPRPINVSHRGLAVFSLGLLSWLPCTVQAQSTVPTIVVREAPPLLLPPEPAGPALNAPELGGPEGEEPAGAEPAVLGPAVLEAAGGQQEQSPQKASEERKAEDLTVDDLGPDSFTPSGESQEWLSALVRKHLPHNYEKKKDWGRTTRSFDGVSIQLDDGKLKTHRKYKQKNDGRWQIYRVELVNPEKTFDVRIANIRERADGRIGMNLQAVARMKVFTRQSLWEHGVQLFSVSANADTRVRLTAKAAVATQLDPTRFPPDVQLTPEVTAARLEILDFELERVSDLHGPVVRSLSHTVREVLEDKLEEDNAKLVASLNKSIAKQDKKLRLSMSDLMKSKWSGLLTRSGTGEASEK